MTATSNSEDCALKFAYTTLFKRNHSGLSKSDRKLIDKAIRQLAKRPYHPFPKGLRVHKLEGVLGTSQEEGGKRPPVWEMHANGPLIITFQYEADEIIFRNCGDHATVLRNP